jgi:hypothetical protein
MEISYCPINRKREEITNRFIIFNILPDPVSVLMVSPTARECAFTCL